MVDAYYSTQALPHFSGRTTRQRGSGIGALVVGAGSIAIPLAKKYLLPVAKKFGRQLLTAGVEEAANVFAKRKSPKQALKSAVSTAVRKQMGGGGVKKRKAKRKAASQRPRRKSKARKQKKSSGRKRKRHSSSGSAKRSRLSFFSKVNNDY